MARLTVRMKPIVLFSMLLASGLFFCGCASPGFKPPQPKKERSIVVTPDTSLSAKVVSFNAVGRFVVLSFPIGELPANGQHLFLYRNGLKTGEVNITGPQRDNDTVADLVTGNAQVGDEVRDQ